MSLKFHSLILFTFLISFSYETIEKNNDFSFTVNTNVKLSNQTDVLFSLDTSRASSVIFTDQIKPLGNMFRENVPSYVTFNTDVFSTHVNGFEFETKMDLTNINNDQVQGIIGLGWYDGQNSLVDALLEQGQIDEKELYITLYPSPKISFKDYLPPEDVQGFSECKPAYGRMDKNYWSMWSCDTNGIVIPKDKVGESGLREIFVQETEKIKNMNEEDNDENNNEEGENEISEILMLNEEKALFDLKSYYITIPSKYMENFKDYYNGCQKVDNEGYTHFKCIYSDSDINAFPSIFFFFDGIAYEIPANKLFVKLEMNNFMSLIRFSNDPIDQNAILYGYPLFSVFTLKFNYENGYTGFKGGNMFDLNKEWNDLNEEYNKLNGSIFNNKFFLIGAIALGAIIIIVVVFIILKKKKEHGPLSEEP